jgi:hypothetical protein
VSARSLRKTRTADPDVLRAVSVLWPAPARLRFGRGQSAPAGWRTREQYVVARRRAVLLPARRLPAAGLVASKAQAGLPVHQRLLRLISAGGLAAGVAQRACGQRLLVELPESGAEGPAGVADLLAEMFGRRIHLGVTVGSERANRKPSGLRARRPVNMSSSPSSRLAAASG